MNALKHSLEVISHQSVFFFFSTLCLIFCSILSIDNQKQLERSTGKLVEVVVGHLHRCGALVPDTTLRKDEQTETSLVEIVKLCCFLFPFVNLCYLLHLLFIIRFFLKEK